MNVFIRWLAACDVLFDILKARGTISPPCVCAMARRAAQSTFSPQHDCAQTARSLPLGSIDCHVCIAMSIMVVSASAAGSISGGPHRKATCDGKRAADIGGSSARGRAATLDSACGPNAVFASRFGALIVGVPVSTNVVSVERYPIQWGDFGKRLRSSLRRCSKV